MRAELDRIGCGPGLPDARCHCARRSQHAARASRAVVHSEIPQARSGRARLGPDRTGPIRVCRAGIRPERAFGPWRSERGRQGRPGLALARRACRRAARNSGGRLSLSLSPLDSRATLQAIWVPVTAQWQLLRAVSVSARSACRVLLSSAHGRAHPLVHVRLRGPACRRRAGLYARALARWPPRACGRAHRRSGSPFNLRRQALERLLALRRAGARARHVLRRRTNHALTTLLSAQIAKWSAHGSFCAATACARDVQAKEIAASLRAAWMRAGRILNRRKQAAS